ncbi:hypothetical protein B0T17DRAFT_542911 [Bombardia bombarda]|uniref:Uncharacterized protein n=1 Tax=Bombardia bombarda TaxID=252184 RepID=A0AA39TUU7_9PEZI|nr:hypothetical protein B0T17DRAFT_542911 [Bombardia bombarda]
MVIFTLGNLWGAFCPEAIALAERISRSISFNSTKNAQYYSIRPIFFSISLFFFSISFFGSLSPIYRMLSGSDLGGNLCQSRLCRLHLVV